MFHILVIILSSIVGHETMEQEMKVSDAEPVCVIIAAKNAANTIGTAIKSALGEAAVKEVIVVDDGSQDGTSAVASRADDGTDRLTVVSFPENRGPAAARNHAIAISRSPLIAILDADDFFFAGRFAAMLQHAGWDFIADNIAFTQDSAGDLKPQSFQARARNLSTLDFIEGNISKPGVRRGEIGFLKPLMRRSFLEEHDLRYNEALRLGEDYDFYLRALIKGARYTIIEHCGYGAVVRPDSLSGQHRTEDLRRLWEADHAIGMSCDLSPEVGDSLARHEKHIRDRYELRAFLDEKTRGGPVAALRHAFGRPAALPAIASGIFRDKTRRFRAAAEIDAAPATGLRYLLAGVPVAQK